MFNATIQAVMDEVDALRHQVTDHMQVPKAEALVLAQLVRLGRFASLCEIGVSYGFSTLHLAAAAGEHGGRVHAFDINPYKIERATDHLRRAGLLATVTLHLGDARELVAQVVPEKPYDFAFIDAFKPQSDAYLDALLPKLAPRAVLATDNTNSHSDQLAAFVQRLRALPTARSCNVPVGNGIELTVLGE